jgi:hypothetical protein
MLSAEFCPTRAYDTGAVLVAFDHSRRLMALLLRGESRPWLERYENLGWLDAQDHSRDGHLHVLITFRRAPGDPGPRHSAFELSLRSFAQAQEFLRDWPAGRTFLAAADGATVPFL